MDKLRFSKPQSKTDNQIVADVNDNQIVADVNDTEGDLQQKPPCERSIKMCCKTYLRAFRGADIGQNILAVRLLCIANPTGTGRCQHRQALPLPSFVAVPVGILTRG